MRIAHVVASIGHLEAGPSHCVPALCNALADLGHDVELHTLETGGATHRSDARYQLHAYPFPGTDHRYAVSLPMLRGLFDAARRADVVHWNGLWSAACVFPALAGVGGSAKLVMSPHGMLEGVALARRGSIKRAMWSLAQGHAARRACCVHVTAESEATSVRAAGLAQPVAVVPYGIDLPPERAALRPGQERTLLYLGRLHPIKGLTSLLAAWSAVEAEIPAWNLRIVGPDSDGHERELRRLLATLGLRRATIMSAVYGAERDRMMSDADFFVLPSHSENFGMTVVEALAVGLPVLASRGTPWAALEREACGFWVDNEPRALAAAIRHVAALTDQERSRMGVRARAWAARDFGWAGIGERMAGVYAWLLERGPRPADVDGGAV